MFKRKTVMILGAGASRPYGYPLGQGLVDEIISSTSDYLYIPKNNLGPLNNLSELSDYFKNNSSNYEKIKNKMRPDSISPGEQFQHGSLSQYFGIKELKTFLKDFDPVTIDSFLRDHNNFNDIGKLMIVYSLLKFEDERFFKKREANERVDEDGWNNWYRMLVNKICAECDAQDDIFKNKLDIVTFNYDLSLEYYLMSRLPGMAFFKDVGERFTSEFIKKRITHVYGKCYNVEELNNYSHFMDPFRCEGTSQVKAAAEISIDNSIRFLRANSIKNNIQLIQEREKMQDKDISDKIKKADDVYIIGFGFDEQNVEHLDLMKALVHGKASKNLFLFNYNNVMTNISGKLREKLPARINIIESKSKKIENAFLYDFKVL